MWEIQSDSLLSFQCFLWKTRTNLKLDNEAYLCLSFRVWKVSENCGPVAACPFINEDCRSNLRIQMRIVEKFSLPIGEPKMIVPHSLKQSAEYWCPQEFNYSLHVPIRSMRLCRSMIQLEFAQQKEQLTKKPSFVHSTSTSSAADGEYISNFKLILSISVTLNIKVLH